MSIPTAIGMFAIGLIPLACCYVTIPWFRTAVNRRLTFQPLDYDAVKEILDDGMPERLELECLQASYKSNKIGAFESHIDFYPHRDGVVVCRMKVDPAFPIAPMFHKVLVSNINALCVKSKQPPMIRVNYSTYPVVEFDYDDKYLLIYFKHQ